MQLCPNCASPLEEGARFCGACGAKIEAETPAQAPAAAEPMPAQTYEPAPQTFEPAYPAAGYQEPSYPQQAYNAPVQTFEPAPQTFEPVYPAAGYQEPQYQQPQYPAGYQPAQQAYGGTAAAVADAPVPTKKKSKVKLFVIIGISVVLVAAIAVTLILFWDKIFGGSGSDEENSMTVEEAFEEYTGAVAELDTDKVIEYSYDLNFIKGEDIDAKQKEIKETLDGVDSSYKSILKMIEFKMESSDKLSDDDLKKRAEELSETYNDTDKITEIVKVTFSMSVMGQSNSQTLEAIKVNGKWYFKAVDSNGLLGL